MKKRTAVLIKREHVFHKDEFECSSCGFRAGKPFAVCPRCGAAMTGRKTDPRWVDEMEALDAIFGD